MFFYRPWAGNEDKFPASRPDFFASQFSNHRWGYGTLLILTLLGGVLLNGSILGAFIHDWKNLKKMPFMVIFMLALRDLMVGFLLIPICVHWYIANIGAFPGGHILCSVTAFLDFTLATEYALILIVFSIILYTRKFPKIEDTLDHLPMEEMIHHSPPASISYPDRSNSRQMNASRQGSRAPSVNGSRPPSVNGAPMRQGSRPPSVNGSRAPSVAGSVDGYRRQHNNSQQGFQPRRPVLSPPKRPGSVTGSIEGRLATSTPSQGYPNSRGGRQFIASSPLHEETEEDVDLWDAASLDYPGRQSPRTITDWEEVYENDDELIFYDEPRYHHWHLYLLCLTWLLALGLGIPAAMFVNTQQNEVDPYGSNGPKPNFNPTQRLASRPGCFIHADPFKNPYSATVNDPGYNFTLSFIIVAYCLTFVVMILMFGLLCYKETKSPKFKRFVKILMCTFVIFMISRSPIDILQLKGLIEAAMGFKQLNILAYELEYEILLFWCTYLPIVLHPIAYLSFVSEFRNGAMKTWRVICGCQKKYEMKQQAKMDKYKSDEILSERSAVSKTQVSNIL